MNNYLSGNKYSENTSAKSNVSAKKDKKINNDRSKSADIVKKKDAMQVFDRLYTVKVREVTPEKKENRSKSPRTSINYLKENKNVSKKSADKKKEDI